MEGGEQLNRNTRLDKQKGKMFTHEVLGAFYREHSWITRDRIWLGKTWVGQMPDAWCGSTVGKIELDRGKPRTGILRSVEQSPGFGSFKALSVHVVMGTI